MATTDTKPAPDGHRGFQLHVQPASNGMDLALVETNGSPAHQRQVGTLPASRYQRAADTVVNAIRTSGRQPSVLKPTRKAPIKLDEIAGVRLALAVNVIVGVRKPGRPRALLDGLNRLTDEECLYWYAACLSGRETDNRRLRALRLYLADD